MRTVTCAFLLASSVAFLSSCARDVYPKYLRMKQESVWLEKTCSEGLASDTKYVYKGSGASIYINCLKTTALGSWVESLETDLVKSGWLLKKRTATANTFCLKNEAIYLLVIPNSDAEQRSIVLSYPSNLCAQEPIEGQRS